MNDEQPAAPVKEEQPSDPVDEEQLSPVEKPEEALEERLPKSLKEGAEGFWHRLQESVIPDIHYLPDEHVQLEIRMAPYRRRAPLNLLIGFAVLLVLLIFLALLSTAFSWASSAGFVLWFSVVLCLAGLAGQLENLLLYEQWRFILTNKRIILVTPAPSRRGLADAIYLRRGQIQVIDTNWSTNPFWGIYQAMRGSRDVMLSMSGYEFKEEGAEVKGGLRFPDVMPADILRLEELIFG